MITICRWLLVAALLAGCDGKPKFQSTDLTGAPYGKALELTDQQGKARRLEDWRGKAVVLFFGFTRCPDVCPTTLAEIAGAVKSLGADYVVAFDPRFVALRGDAAATQRVAKEFKIYYEKRPQGASYTIDHSAQAYVLDPQGRLRLLVRHDRIGKDLAPDLRALLREAA